MSAAEAHPSKAPGLQLAFEVLTIKQQKCPEIAVVELRVVSEAPVLLSHKTTWGLLRCVCLFAAAASGTVVEFVGVRCHVNCGAHDYWPRVVRFKATIAALQVREDSNQTK